MKYMIDWIFVFVATAIAIFGASGMYETGIAILVSFIAVQTLERKSKCH